MIYQDISITTKNPLWYGSGNSQVIKNYSSYSQVIAADGGYISADITIAANYDLVYDWLNNGLCRHIEVFNEYNQKIWEGFVDSVSVNFAPLSVVVGPVSEIANRVTLKYSDFTVGQPARTTATNDTNSQGRYGIIHKVISAGSVSSTNATSIRDAYLKEHRFPKSSPTVSSQQTTGNSISISCAGYGKFFELYPYNETTDTTYTAREKVLEVIGDCPNKSYGIFSSDYSNIESNSLSVFRKDNDDRVAKTVISDIVNLGGDANNNRRIFGVLNDRRIYLTETDNSVSYRIRMSDAQLSIRDNSDNIVQPWNIQAGKWLDIIDYPSFVVAGSDFGESPGKIFIESVTYTAPRSWQINGGKTNTLPQQLSKLGLGSI